MSDLYLIHSINEPVPHGPYLVHHGILGQKWGIRRFQNPDGTLTDAGKARVAKNDKRISNESQKFLKLRNLSNEAAKTDKVLSAKYFRESDKIVGNMMNDIVKKGYLNDVDNNIKNKLKENEKTVNDFLKDYDQIKSQNIASIAMSLDKNLDGNTKTTLPYLYSNTITIGFHDNGGYYNSYKTHSIINNKENEFKNVSKKHSDTVNYVNDQCNKIAKDYLKNNDVKTTSVYKPELSSYLGEYMATHVKIKNNIYKSDQSKIANAEHDSSNYSQKEIIKNVKTAEKIYNNASKIVNTGELSGWEKLREASYALGYQNIPSEKLTDAQWNRLNKYCREN